MDRALERSLWEVGPFRLTPNMRIGAGYDSNAILTGDAANPDVNALFAPGLDAVIPIRDRLLVELYEELDFVYYRDLVELRDVFNVTRVGGAFGGKSVVLRVTDEFRRELVRPTREFDVPVDQRSNRLGAPANFSVGSLHELGFEYEKYRVEIQDSGLAVGGVSIESLLDRVEESYGVILTRHLTTETAALVEGFFGTQVYDDETVERDADSYGLLGGFSFSPTGNVNGEARLGYKRVVPDSPAQPGFKGIIGSANVTMRLGQRYSLEGVYFRDTAPSLLRETLYVVTSVYGAVLEVYLGRRFSIRPGIRFRRNDYPEIDSASTIEQSRVVLIRRSEAVSLNFDYRLTPNWLVRVGGRFSKRETSSPSAPEERFTVNVGLTTVF